jgi:phosphoglycerate kinase
MKIKTLSDFDLKNKKVLLRLDLNTEIINGKAILSERMKAHQITLNELKKKKAITVVLAHQGRPGDKDFTSLEQHAKLMKVKFARDIIGKPALDAIKSLKPGEILLLDNVRNLKEEFEGTENNSLVKTLSPLFDLYINDAFSVSHRAQTSITGFPKVLPCCMGRVMEEEVKSLEKINLKDTLYILGGAKPKENIDVLKNSKNVLTCGIFGQLCTIAKGINLGAQNKFLEKEIQEFVPILKPLVKNIQTPIDFAVKVNGKRKELLLENFPSEYEIFDIGEQTQKLYIKKISQAKSIFMKGVAGYCEDKQFCQGTKTILTAITKSKAFSVVGGGHTSEAIAELKIPKSKFGYVSLSGGALDEYIAGKVLPGLEVLKK